MCEEITRFILDDRLLTQRLKKMRHAITKMSSLFSPKIRLLETRDSLKDIGYAIRLKSEFKRDGIKDIFFANIQRVKESVRVLEEFSKLSCLIGASGFKKLRYDLYEIEKETALKFTKLNFNK